MFMTVYEIQTVSNGHWTNDASLLGDGLDQSANCWSTEADAIATMNELLDIWPDAKLRVVAVDA